MQLIFLKLIVAIVVVLALSHIAERVGPRVAGILAGAPTGTPLSLFFFGIEIGPAFAAHSSIYNIIGVVAMLACITAYYRASLRLGMFLSATVACGAYGFVILILHWLPMNTIGAVCIAFGAILLFGNLLKGIPTTHIARRVPLTPHLLLLRALSAAASILAITALAKLVGSTWSGLFSSFPTTLFPLLLIVHMTYGKEHAHTIIKHVPYGAVPLVLYSLTVSLAYPTIGVVLGTVAAFGVAISYLIGYQFISQRSA